MPPRSGDDDQAPNNVTYLPVPAGPPPAVRDGTLPERGEVFEAELVEDEDPWAVQKAEAFERYHGYRHDVVVVGRVAKRVVTHDRTKTAVRAVARNVLYVPAGIGVDAKRLWDAKTNSPHMRALRAAEASGDHEKIVELLKLAEQAKQSRHERHMDWSHAPGRIAKALVTALVYLLLLLLVVGVMVAVAGRDFTRILDPVLGFLDLVQGIVVAVTVAWVPFVLVAPWVAVLRWWNVGRTKAPTPAWVAPVAERRDMAGAPITPSIVVTALRDLGISELRNAIKRMDDNGAGMLSAIRLAGCGVEVDVTLPSGGDIAQIKARHAKLAGNLNRHPHELFITIPKAARTIRLWIADSGALDEPIGPSPLVTDPDATADLYTGRAPWGENLRGDQVALSLLQRHLLITGLSNQGKTAALRALVLWLVLDPTVELRIADLKGVGDWRMFSPIATEFIQGPTDEHVMDATEMLEAGVDEMNRRTAAAEATGATDGITRDMARSGQGFHPLFLIVDEAQVAYMCPAIGQDGRPYGGQSNKSRYFMAARQLHNQGRAVNVLLWQGTQDPTNQNLPVLVREGAHIRASLVLSTESQSRMAVGDKAVNGGAAPHKLRQGLDKGTLVVAGDGVDIPDGQPSITVRTHYIDGATAADLAQHAAQRRAAVVAAPEEEVRDLLADVAAVLHGEELVKATDVAARLRDHAPAYLPYHGLSAQALAGKLAKAGVKVSPLDGYLTVRSERVHAALAAGAVNTPGDGQ